MVKRPRPMSGPIALDTYSASRPISGACFQQGGLYPTPVPQGGNSAFLWNMPQSCGIPLEPTEPIDGQMYLSRKLADDWGKSRLYMHDMPDLENPVFGKQFACAMPPFVPQPIEKPADLSMADMPHHFPTADPIYRENLFIKPFFKETPIVTNQQLYGGYNVNCVLA